MICLTGDVHHMSLKAKDQPYLSGSEIDASMKYLQIAAGYGISVTLFITGKCFIEEPKKIDALLKMKNLEIGGHNYFAFKPRLPFKMSYRLFGRKNGPAFFQQWEVKKTLETIEQHTGTPAVSWRNHGYRNDRNTPGILKQNGIRCYSDCVDPNVLFPYSQYDMTIVPVNVIPDHEYVYHGSLRKGVIDESKLLNLPFATQGCTVEQWFQKVVDSVATIDEQGGLATLLIHPACMEVADDFVVFKKLCRILAKYRSSLVRDVRPVSDEANECKTND